MKKVLALVLAVMLVVGMAPTVFATKYDKGTLALAFSDNGGWLMADEGRTASGTVNPGANTSGDKLYIVTKGANNTAAPLVKRDISDSSIDVKFKASKGAKAIDKVEIAYDDNGFAYINLKFIGTHVSTGTIDFDVQVYVTASKSTVSKVNYNYDGTLENKKDEGIDDGYDYFYLGDTPQIKAIAYIKEIELDLGNGVSIFAKLFNDKKYYGKVGTSYKDEDVDVLTQYPDIDEVYYLDTVGLNSASNYVKIDSDGFVYNGDLEYLGKTSDKLPYSTKYYVASVELDVEDADEDGTPVDGDDAGNPEMGGDDVPANVNDNPGTGR